MLSDGQSLSFAMDREKPLTGQILLSLAHPISHPEPLTWAPGAEGWEPGLDQGPGQKGSPVEGGYSGRDLGQFLLASLAGQRSHPYPEEYSTERPGIRRGGSRGKKQGIEEWYGWEMGEDKEES